MSKRKSLLEIHTAVFLFGFAGLFGKWLTFSPVVIVVGRVFFASLALAVFLHYFRTGFSIRPSRDIGLLSFFGFFLAVHWTSFFQSIQLSSVAIGLLSFSTCPVFTSFLEPLVFKERVIKSNILFSFLCLGGVFLIMRNFDLQDASFLGVLWGLLSGFTFAVVVVGNRKLARKHSSLAIAFYEDFFATLFLLPFLFFIPISLSLRDFVLLIVLGTLCTAASHSLFINGMKHLQAQTASLINTLEPVYGVILALVFLHEIPTLRTITGGILILMSQILIAIKIFK